MLGEYILSFVADVDGFIGGLSRVQTAMSTVQQAVKVAGSAIQIDFTDRIQNAQLQILQLRERLRTLDFTLPGLTNAQEIGRAIHLIQVELLRTRQEIQNTAKAQKLWLDQSKAQFQAAQAGVNSYLQQLIVGGSLMTQIGGLAERSGVGLLALSAAWFTLGKTVVTTGANFQQSMDVMRSVMPELREGTEESTKAFVELEKVVLQLANTTKFTSTEVADAAKYLGQAGLKAQQVTAALPATLNLSMAGFMDLGRSAEIAADFMNAFKLRGEEVSRVVDVLTKAEVVANTSLHQLANAFSFAAPVAAALGQSIEDAATALAALSNSGIKASRAGTGLAQILSALIQDAGKTGEMMEKYGSSFDAVNPQIKSVVDIILEFNRVGVTAGDTMKFFGERAGRAMLALTNVSPGRLKELQSLINDSFGEGLKQATLRWDNLNGSLAEFKSRLELISITSFKTVETEIKSVVDTLTDGLDKIINLMKTDAFGEWGKAIILVTTSLAALASQFGIALLVIGYMVAKLGGAIVQWASLGQTAQAATAQIQAAGASFATASALADQAARSNTRLAASYLAVARAGGPGAAAAQAQADALLLQAATMKAAATANAKTAASMANSQVTLYSAMQLGIQRVIGYLGRMAGVFAITAAVIASFVVVVKGLIDTWAPLEKDTLFKNFESGSQTFQVFIKVIQDTVASFKGLVSVGGIVTGWFVSFRTYAEGASIGLGALVGGLESFFNTGMAWENFTDEIRKLMGAFAKLWEVVGPIVTGGFLVFFQVLSGTGIVIINTFILAMTGLTAAFRFCIKVIDALVVSTVGWFKILTGDLAGGLETFKNGLNKVGGAIDEVNEKMERSTKRFSEYIKSNKMLIQDQMSAAKSLLQIIGIMENMKEGMELDPKTLDDFAKLKELFGGDLKKGMQETIDAMQKEYDKITQIAKSEKDPEQKKSAVIHAKILKQALDELKEGTAGVAAAQERLNELMVQGVGNEAPEYYSNLAEKKRQQTKLQNKITILTEDAAKAEDALSRALDKAMDRGLKGLDRELEIIRETNVEIEKQVKLQITVLDAKDKANEFELDRMKREQEAYANVFSELNQDTGLKMTRKAHEEYKRQQIIIYYETLETQQGLTESEKQEYKRRLEVLDSFANEVQTTYDRINGVENDAKKRKLEGIQKTRALGVEEQEAYDKILGSTEINKRKKQALLAQEQQATESLGIQRNKALFRQGELQAKFSHSQQIELYKARGEELKAQELHLAEQYRQEQDKIEETFILKTEASQAAKKQALATSKQLYDAGLDKARKEDREKQIKDQLGKLKKAADPITDAHEKAAEALAKQVRTIQDMIMLFQVLHHIRMRQEVEARQAAESAFGADKRAQILMARSSEQPDNAALKYEAKRAMGKASLEAAIFGRKASAAGIYDVHRDIGANILGLTLRPMGVDISSLLGVTLEIKTVLQNIDHNIEMARQAGFGGNPKNVGGIGKPKEELADTAGLHLEDLKRDLGIEPRAEGGPVKSGKPYLVGEKGRELFTPGTSGYITSSGDVKKAVVELSGQKPLGGAPGEFLGNVLDTPASLAMTGIAKTMQSGQGPGGFKYPAPSWKDTILDPSKRLRLEGWGGLAATMAIDPLNFMGGGLFRGAAGASKINSLADLHQAGMAGVAARALPTLADVHKIPVQVLAPAKVSFKDKIRLEHVELKGLKKQLEEARLEFSRADSARHEAVNNYYLSKKTEEGYEKYRLDLDNAKKASGVAYEKYRSFDELVQQKKDKLETMHHKLQGAPDPLFYSGLTKVVSDPQFYKGLTKDVSNLADVNVHADKLKAQLGSYKVMGEPYSDLSQINKLKGEKKALEENSFPAWDITKGLPPGWDEYIEEHNKIQVKIREAQGNVKYREIGSFGPHQLEFAGAALRDYQLSIRDKGIAHQYIDMGDKRISTGSVEFQSKLPISEADVIHSGIFTNPDSPLFGKKGKVNAQELVHFLEKYTPVPGRGKTIKNPKFFEKHEERMPGPILAEKQHIMSWPGKELWKEHHSEYGGVLNPIMRLHYTIRELQDGRKAVVGEEFQRGFKKYTKNVPEEVRAFAYEMGMKKLLQIGVDEGADVLGWVTGENQWWSTLEGSGQVYNSMMHNIAKDVLGKKAYQKSEGLSVAQRRGAKEPWKQYVEGSDRIITSDDYTIHSPGSLEGDKYKNKFVVFDKIDAKYTYFDNLEEAKKFSELTMQLPIHGIELNDAVKARVDNKFSTFGKREKGGPVKAGEPYIVGEKGVEVIVPDSNGTVVPTLRGYRESLPKTLPGSPRLGSLGPDRPTPSPANLDDVKVNEKSAIQRETQETKLIRAMEELNRSVQALAQDEQNVGEQLGTLAEEENTARRGKAQQTVTEDSPFLWNTPEAAGKPPAGFEQPTPSEVEDFKNRRERLQWEQEELRKKKAEKQKQLNDLKQKSTTSAPPIASPATSASTQKSVEPPPIPEGETLLSDEFVGPHEFVGPTIDPKELAARRVAEMERKQAEQFGKSTPEGLARRKKAKLAEFTAKGTSARGRAGAVSGLTEEQLLVNREKAESSKARIGQSGAESQKHEKKMDDYDESMKLAAMDDREKQEYYKKERMKELAKELMSKDRDVKKAAHVEMAGIRAGERQEIPKYWRQGKQRQSNTYMAGAQFEGGDTAVKPLTPYEAKMASIDQDLAANAAAAKGKGTPKVLTTPGIGEQAYAAKQAGQKAAREMAAGDNAQFAADALARQELGGQELEASGAYVKGGIGLPKDQLVDKLYPERKKHLFVGPTTSPEEAPAMPEGQEGASMMPQINNVLGGIKEFLNSDMSFLKNLASNARPEVALGNIGDMVQPRIGMSPNIRGGLAGPNVSNTTDGRTVSIEVNNNLDAERFQAMLETNLAASGFNALNV